MADGLFGTAEGESTVMAVDDAGRYPKPETGAVEILGGVERFEEAFADGG